MAVTKTLQIKYFARFREQLNLEHELFPVSGSVETVQQLIELLNRRGGVWQTVFGENQKFLCAVNQQVVKHNFPLQDNDEVAFYPPVTGG